MANFGKLEFSTSFNPTSAFPLDARCYFTDLSSAQAAAATAEEAGSANTVYHYGMKLLVDDGTAATWYTIMRDGTLSEEGQGGKTPVKGEDYFTEEEIADVAKQAADLVNIEDVDPDKVIFPNGLTTTYAIGKVTLTNGMGTLVEPGGTLTDFFNNFVDEKNPTTTQPSVILSFIQSGAYEVGTTVTERYAVSLNPGKYTYGPATGVTATAWEITDTQGNSYTELSGYTNSIKIKDDTNYKLTATATYDDGSIPVTNLGNEYPAGQILAGSKTATSGAITGYRRSFYGTTTDKAELNSSKIRSLSGKTTTALKNGSTFTINIPVGAMRVVIAYPATLRDLTSVKDVNGMNAEIVASFTKSILPVDGAFALMDSIDYKVYTFERAEAVTEANKYNVTI